MTAIYEEKVARRNRRKKYPFRGLGSFYSAYECRAKDKNQSFSLTIDQFVSLIFSKCHYCGVNPYTLRLPHGSRYRSIFSDEVGFFAHGIDRVDNDKGYTPENSVTCCPCCNYAKKDMPVSKFLTWINNVRHPESL